MSTKLFFKNLTGQKKFELSVELTDKIEQHLDQVCEFFGFEKDTVRIIFGGKVLEHSSTFKECGLQNESSIIIVPKPKPKKGVVLCNSPCAGMMSIIFSLKLPFIRDACRLIDNCFFIRS